MAALATERQRLQDRPESASRPEGGNKPGAGEGFQIATGRFAMRSTAATLALFLGLLWLACSVPAQAQTQGEYPLKKLPYMDEFPVLVYLYSDNDDMRPGRRIREEPV